MVFFILIGNERHQLIIYRDLILAEKKIINFKRFTYKEFDSFILALTNKNRNELYLRLN